MSRDSLVCLAIVWDAATRKVPALAKSVSRYLESVG